MKVPQVLVTTDKSISNPRHPGEENVESFASRAKKMTGAGWMGGVSDRPFHRLDIIFFFFFLVRST
jgi:hypothetical protein